jgi:uncharacterized protein (UPF0332 family)
MMLAESKTPLEKAESLLKTAYQELEAARQTAELERARDAAGKAWAALVEATRALFLTKGVKEEELPRTHRGTRFMLCQHGNDELRLIYSDAYEDVHQDADYDGLINFGILEGRFSDINRFIEAVRGWAQ